MKSTTKQYAKTRKKWYALNVDVQTVKQLRAMGASHTPVLSPRQMLELLVANALKERTSQSKTY